MVELEHILMNLEQELEKKARKQYAEDVKASRLRLMGYIDGVQAMRILFCRYLKEYQKEAETVRGKEEQEDKYDTDLIREIVDMHEKVKAILLLLKQIDFLGGNKEDVSEIFGKES